MVNRLLAGVPLVVGFCVDVLLLLADVEEPSFPKQSPISSCCFCFLLLDDDECQFGNVKSQVDVKTIFFLQRWRSAVGDGLHACSGVTVMSEEWREG